MEFRNLSGTIALARAWGLSQEEMHRLLQEVRKEASEKGLLEKKQFDIQTMRYLSLEEWLAEHLEKRRECRSPCERRLDNGQGSD